MSAMIHVAVSPSVDYLPHCAVMLESLFFHNKNEVFKVHVLWQSESPNDPIKKLEEFIESRKATCTVYGIGREYLDQLPGDSAWNNAVWLKILIPKVVYEKRVIYLDSDLIIRSSVREIWGSGLQDNLLAAVQEVIPAGWLTRTHKNVPKLGLGAVSNYFNSGVMVMNLQAIRDANLDDQLLDYASDPYSEKAMADQDTLNAVIHGAWERLPLKWNVGYHFFKYRNFDSPLCSASFCEAVQGPAVLHFCGPEKPWKSSCRNPYRNEYIKHLRTTPWAKDGYDAYDFWGRVLFKSPLIFRRWMYLYVPMIKRAIRRFRVG